jgi:hypothetical protein
MSRHTRGAGGGEMTPDVTWGGGGAGGHFNLFLRNE